MQEDGEVAKEALLINRYDISRISVILETSKNFNFIGQSSLKKEEIG